MSATKHNRLILKSRALCIIADVIQAWARDTDKNQDREVCEILARELLVNPATPIKPVRLRV
jgi:hypothetical protein